MSTMKSSQSPSNFDPIPSYTTASDVETKVTSHQMFSGYGALDVLPVCLLPQARDEGSQRNRRKNEVKVIEIIVLLVQFPTSTRIQLAGQSVVLAILLSKMRSVFLLFAVIASLMLAVCCVPVPEPARVKIVGKTPKPKPRKHPGPPKPAAAPPPTVQHAGKPSKPKAKGRVTLVDTTGQMTTGTDNTNIENKDLYAKKSAITRVISRAIGQQNNMHELITYKGHYVPVQDEGLIMMGSDWVFFKLEGVLKQCAAPIVCYAWKAKSTGFSIHPKTGEPKYENSDQVYSGIVRLRSPSPGINFSPPSSSTWEMVVVFDLVLKYSVVFVPGQPNSVVFDAEKKKYVVAPDKLKEDTIPGRMLAIWVALSNRFEEVFKPKPDDPAMAGHSPSKEASAP
ncbi:hypothetical protein BDP27DRAFT_1427375 [Rhodocollybia butyracea]|uniref:Uncharacterized protein n=1 Tax=Rhodocollybia butyracea TaxID=206335 RepID=A0A9P5PJ11_9AGAR|nr:hypothetical protein BDP27DRAFT_1427375 [Rhodocollybia butyracea]